MKARGPCVLAIGRSFVDLDSRFELLETLGNGSFAKVYRARDRELGREVAIKQIHDQYLEDPAQLERFWQEAQLLASLSHPNIVTIYDLYRERGWIIMELMQASVAERFADRQMSISAVRTTLAHGLRALKYLHSRGIVHGDIKPSNLMIDSRRRIKIGDFGLARRVSDEEGSLIKGTTKYMAPEVVSEEFGEIGPASDLYSLGFCAYELMCGSNFESLFPGLSAFGRNKQIAWMMWHAAGDRRLPPVNRVLEGVPEDLATVVDKLTDKKQSARYSSADAALSDLKVDLKLVKSEDLGELAAEEAAEDQARKKRLIFAGGAFAVSLILCLFLLFFDGSKPPEAPQTLVRFITEVYPGQNAIKVEDPERTFAKEISLGEDPRIYLTNTEKNIVLRELLPGDRVEIETESDDRGHRRFVIKASRPIESRGIIKSIDRAHGRILVAIDDGKRREDVELRVPAHAEIFKRESGQDVKAHLRDINQEDEVTVTHLDELGETPGRFVVSLLVRSMEEGVGFVSHLDAENRQLTVTFGTQQNARKLSLPVASSCEIKLGGEAKSLEDLQPADRVRFRYDTEFQQILVLRDETLSQALVEDVTPDRNELKLSDAMGKDRSFVVPPVCEITIGRQPAALSDLRKYDTVDLTWHESEGQSEASTIMVTRRIVKEDRVALLIGIENYEDKALTRLSFPIANVQLLRGQLIARYAFNPDRLEMLLDPSRADFEKKVQAVLGGVNRDTEVIVYFCGHIYRTPDDKYVIATREFEWDQRADTGLPFRWLMDELEKCPSTKKLLLLDSCHPGQGTDLSFQHSPKTVVKSLDPPPRTTSIIGNCDDDERGHLLDQGKHSLFAYELAQGFGGPADANRDLVITPSELFTYLSTTIKSARIPAGRTQTPVLIESR